MRRLLCFIIFTICCSSALAATPPDWPEAAAAVMAAEQFTQSLDAGNYRQVWQGASPLFQALNPEQTWTTRQQAIHTAYGSSQNRQFRHLDQRTSYTLSPDGHYCVVQFNSSFQNKQVTIETIVMVESPAGVWQLREYIIR